MSDAFFGVEWGGDSFGFPFGWSYEIQKEPTVAVRWRATKQPKDIWADVTVLASGTVTGKNAFKRAKNAARAACRKAGMPK